MHYFDFHYSWEQRKVTEIGKIYIGLVTTMTKHYTDEGTLLIRNSDIKDGKFEFGDNPIYLEKTFAEKNETRMHQIGDVITVHTGDVGTSAVITENEAKSIGFATIVTRPNPKIIDSNYLCSFLNTDKHKKWAVSISTGDGRTNYNLGDYFELVVPVPSIAEQKKIASYIQKLNRLITLHQREFAFLCKEKSKKFRYIKNAWEQRKWINTVDISTNMVDPKSGKYDLLPHVAPGNIESFTGRLYDNVKLVGEENLISGKFVFNVGDIVYGKINPQLGKYVFARFSGLTSADAYVLNAKNGIVQKFLYAVIQTRDFYDYSVSVSKRSGMPKINRDELNAYSYWAPSESEQLKIGEYLLTLDHLITLHQRKYDKLTNVKKSMLEKMFPQNGSNAPEIRFKGFTEAWEQRKAIDIADYSKGNGYSKGDLTDAGTPIILYGRLYTKYQFAISEVDTFAVPRNGAVYSQGNEVIVPASGETAEDIARASAVEKSGVLLGGDLNILRPFDFINPLFLALAISNGEPQKELAKKAQGKSVVHIHNTDIQEVTIVYPSRTEQDRIVSVFRQLDHLITLHQRELEKLKNLKKACLEKMFV